VADLSSLTRTYPALVRARVRSDWQYRTSFVLLAVTWVVFAFADFVAVAVFFHNVDDLAGWSLGQTAVLYGMAGTSFALGDALTSHVEQVSRHVKAGSFDRFLLRPIGPYLLLAADEFAFRRLGKLVQSLVVLVIAMAVVDIGWTAPDVAVLVGSIVSGTVIFGAIWCVTSSLAFWTVETQEVASSFTHGGNLATQYPADVYTGWLRRLLVTVVPLGFVAYLPLAWILGKPRALGLDPVWGFTSPLAAAALVLVARATWRAGLRHYRSTGS
jgi:ABC-2 type transport system permease protein